MTLTSNQSLELRVRLLEDIEEIRKLKARYCRFQDGGWAEHGPTHMGPSADLFVEDGVFDGRPLMPLAEGREAIRTLFLNYRAVPFALHHVMNPLIEVQGDHGEGHWHLIVCATQPDATSHCILGSYLEEYVRTPVGWRFKTMRVVIARAFEQVGGWGVLGRSF
jgi:hypothetical protein